MATQAGDSGGGRSVQDQAAEKKGEGMTIGTQLRQARSEQKRLLSEVARETKIQGWVLEALEEDRLQEQMSPVYVKGLLTSYARALHLPPEPLLAQLTAPPPAAVQEALPPAPPPRPARPARAPRPARPARRPVSIHLPKFLTGRFGSALALGTCGLALVFLTPVGGWISHQSTAAITAIKQHSARVAAARPPKPAPRKKMKVAKAAASARPNAPAAAPSTPALASTPQPASPAPTLAAMVPLAEPIKPSAPAPAAKPTPAPAKPTPAPAKPTTPPPLTLIPGKPLELQLNVQRTMWVRVRADGKLLAQQRLPRGTTERWTAKKVFQLIVANPAEVQLTLNGQSITPLLQTHQGRLMITHHGVTRLPDD
jgi:cytoskeletal protein RodZ